MQYKFFFLYVVLSMVMVSVDAFYYKKYPDQHNYCYATQVEQYQIFPYFLADLDTGERCGYSYFSRRLAAMR